MNKLACRAAATLLMAALASCGGGGGESSTGLPATQSPTSQSISEPVPSPAVAAKAELQEPSGIQGQLAAQADSLGGVAGLRGQDLDALSERAQMRSIWVDSGSVSARFVPSANARFLLFGPGPATAFVPGDSLTTSEQTASGAMVSLNDIFLLNYDPSVAHGITRATRDINGDANFALGRWAAGMVSALFWIDLTVRGSDYNNYHYLAFNRLMSWPASGSPTCDSGVFTSPTYINGGPTGKPARGTVTASVTLSFDTYGAVVNGPINVTAGSETGTLNLSARPFSGLTTPFVYSDSKTFLSVALGDAGNNATLIAVGYETTLPSGSRYRGVAKFRCS